MKISQSDYKFEKTASLQAPSETLRKQSRESRQHVRKRSPKAIPKVTQNSENSHADSAHVPDTHFYAP